MYVVSVTVFVEDEHVKEFIEVTLDNARNTRKEPDNVRFDVLRCNDVGNRFLLYEAYTNEGGFKRHQQTSHYLRWREAVAGWMAQPRLGVKHTSLFPEDVAW